MDDDPVGEPIQRSRFQPTERDGIGRIVPVGIKRQPLPPVYCRPVRRSHPSAAMREPLAMTGPSICTRASVGRLIETIVVLAE